MQVTRAFSFTKTPKRVIQRAFMASSTPDDRSPGPGLDHITRMTSSSTLAVSISCFFSSLLSKLFIIFIKIMDMWSVDNMNATLIASNRFISNHCSASCFFLSFTHLTTYILLFIIQTYLVWLNQESLTMPKELPLLTKTSPSSNPADLIRLIE